MRIFLTGATGYVGSAVLEALIRAGHEITAVVRDGGKAQQLLARGVRAIAGNLAEPASYRDAALGHQGYVHTAFESSARAADVDRLTIETLVEAARHGLGEKNGAAADSRFLIYTSGIWVLGQRPEPAVEESELAPAEIVSWRPAHERRVLDAGGDGLRTAIIRPGIVYGGKAGIVGDLFRDAVNGLIRVIGRGENHWPLIYDRDLADLYARLAARADADGVFHANDEGDERVNDLVEAIGSHVTPRPDVRHVPLEEALAKHGAYAAALALDQIVRSPRARALGWAPTLRSVSGNAARLLGEWRTGQAGAQS
jgi:nucleoside-diphosphate-sugar epimerase